MQCPVWPLACWSKCRQAVPAVTIFAASGTSLAAPNKSSVRRGTGQSSKLLNLETKAAWDRIWLAVFVRSKPVHVRTAPNMNISSSWVAESTLLLLPATHQGGNHGRDSGGNAADFADGAQDGAFPVPETFSICLMVGPPRRDRSAPDGHGCGRPRRGEGRPRARPVRARNARWRRFGQRCPRYGGGHPA